MKKKILALGVCVSMLAVAIVGGTMAYFTDTDAAENVMAVGNVKIVQDEQQKVIGEEVDDKSSDYVAKPNDNLETFEQNKKLFPMVDNRPKNDAGEFTENTVIDGYFNGKMANVLDKIVTVSNDGSEDAYVRTILAFETATEYEENTSTVRRDGKTIFHTYIGTLKNAGFQWLERNTVKVNDVEYVIGVMVYDEALAPKTTTAPSLKQFFLSPEADNEVSLLFGDKYNVLAISQATQTAGFEPIVDDAGNITKTAAAVALDAAFGDLTNINDVTDAELIEWLSNAQN